MNKQSILSTVIAMLVVMQVISTPVAAAATDDKPLCSELNPLERLWTACADDSKVIDGNAEETHGSIYADAVVNEERLERDNVESYGLTNLTERAMYSEAVREIVASLNDEETLTTAELDSTQEVNEEASELQKSAWASQNERVSDLRFYQQTVNETEFLSNNDVFGYPAGIIQFEEVNVSTFDGETIVVQTMEKPFESDGGSVTYAFSYTWYTGEHSNSDLFSAEVYPPESIDKPQATVLSPNEEKNKLQNIDDARQRVIDNIDVLADDIYSQYQPGEISAADLLGPGAFVGEFGADGGAGHFSYAAAMAASAGYQTDAGASMTVELNQDNRTRTLTGLIFADSTAFENGLQTDVTYDMASINGSVWMSHQSGASTDITQFKQNATFTVTSMVDETTGEEINSTSFSDGGFDTTDTSDLTQRTTEIVEIRKVIEERNDNEASNGPVITNPSDLLGDLGGLGGGVGAFLVVFIVAGVGVVLVARSVLRV